MRAVEHNHKQEYTVITRASFSLSQKITGFPRMQFRQGFIKR